MDFLISQPAALLTSVGLSSCTPFYCRALKYISTLKQMPVSLHLLICTKHNALLNEVQIKVSNTDATFFCKPDQAAGVIICSLDTQSRRAAILRRGVVPQCNMRAVTRVFEVTVITSSVD